MITEKGPVFNSKILLFGEYSLMKGSMALCIPYAKFTGQLLIDNSSEGRSKHPSVVYLSEYLDFLEKNNFDQIINTQEFRLDIERGLYFNLNIPISYGLGSSGAIVAAIYNSYFLQESSNTLSELKTIFSRMESYYHGKSSGLDPLVSYLNKAVLLAENNKLKTIELSKESNKNDISIFLIDTKTIGETQPLVNWFLEKYKMESYSSAIQNQLVPINNNCINNLLSGNDDELFSNIKSLSEFTFDYFNQMIPKSVEKIWKSGLETGNYYLKLCGSGGGGMMLGFTNDIENTLHKLRNYEIHFLER
ncbi:MAG: mevalonate kinase [Bacteroidetes bacterium]|jgi:mevalonate kinase|nr:mevalonate kinase [Bacteroidota bacterium]